MLYFAESLKTRISKLYSYAIVLEIVNGKLTKKITVYRFDYENCAADITSQTDYFRIPFITITSTKLWGVKKTAS